MTAVAIEEPLTEAESHHVGPAETAPDRQPAAWDHPNVKRVRELLWKLDTNRRLIDQYRRENAQFETELALLVQLRPDGDPVRFRHLEKIVTISGSPNKPTVSFEPLPELENVVDQIGF